MNLNNLLWIGGMLFSLGIFAVKVGLGLSLGRIKAKGVFSTLMAYVFLFVLMAFLSKVLVDWLEPVLKKGPYLHLVVALGLMVWGVFTLKGHQENSRYDSAEKNGPFLSAYLLILPCPVCLTAMTFSTWTALAVIKVPPTLVGFGLGLAFALMTLAVMALTTLKRVEHPETALGLTMITMGLYFAASLSLPAKIEEARNMYFSMAGSHHSLNGYQTLGVGAILFALMLIGFFAGKYREVKK